LPNDCTQILRARNGGVYLQISILSRSKQNRGTPSLLIYILLGRVIFCFTLVLLGVSRLVGRAVLHDPLDDCGRRHAAGALQGPATFVYD